jgi:transcriptional regulator with XRE-family HTH domain
MLGKRIRELRKNAGLNQADLARMTGVSRPNISFWEKSAFPPMEAVDKVCRALGLELWEFFAGPDTLDRTRDIGREYQELVHALEELDRESRNDIMEIITILLSKYKKISSIKTGLRTLYSESGQLIPDDRFILSAIAADTETTKNRLPYYARRAGNIALHNYFRSFAWVEH